MSLLLLLLTPRLNGARDIHAGIDTTVRHWVDGSTHTAYHPTLPDGLQLPDISMGLDPPVAIDADTATPPEQAPSARSLIAVRRHFSCLRDVIPIMARAGEDPPLPAEKVRLETSFTLSPF